MTIFMKKKRDEPKNFEKGGKKYLGKIVKTYQKDSAINVTIQVVFIFCCCPEI